MIAVWLVGDVRWRFPVNVAFSLGRRDWPAQARDYRTCDSTEFSLEEEVHGMTAANASGEQR